MCTTRQELFTWHIFLLLPFASLAPLSTYLEPSFCDRIRPPRSQVARKLTPLFPHLAHVPSHPKSRPPLGFPDPNMHLIRTTLRTRPISSRTIIFVISMCVHMSKSMFICEKRRKIQQIGILLKRDFYPVPTKATNVIFYLYYTVYVLYVLDDRLIKFLKNSAGNPQVNTY
jgi:hypothetical protein